MEGLKPRRESSLLRQHCYHRQKLRHGQSKRCTISPPPTAPRHTAFLLGSNASTPTSSRRTQRSATDQLISSSDLSSSSSELDDWLIILIFILIVMFNYVGGAYSAYNYYYLISTRRRPARTVTRGVPCLYTLAKAGVQTELWRALPATASLVRPA